MEKYYDRSSIGILPIDNNACLVIKKSSECRFYADDVLIEVNGLKNYLILEDSFEFCAYPELINSIKVIKDLPLNKVIESIGAPCDKGGLQLFINKISNHQVVLDVIAPNNKLMYSKETYVSNLIEWKNILDQIYVDRVNIFRE